METLASVAWDAFRVLYPIALLSISIRGLILWLVERVRIADWIGYTVHALFLLAAPIQLWDLLGGWGVIPAVIGVSLGLLWVQRDRRQLHASGPREEVLGYFLVSRQHVPVGVRNWFA